MSREPIRLPEIQYPVFGIFKINLRGSLVLSGQTLPFTHIRRGYGNIVFCGGGKIYSVKVLMMPIKKILGWYFR